MKNLELDNLSLVELSSDDASNINGGSWGKLLKTLWDHTLGYVIGEVIEGVGQGVAEPCKPCPPCH